MTTFINNIIEKINNPLLNTTTILSVLAVTIALTLFELLVYKLVSKRTFYNKSFSISLVVIAPFIATIILALQSNLVITLGTIGALAIIRFRTAVKDPIDMVYLLWSIHTGIVCGCQLYGVGIITSLVVALVLLILENINFTKKPMVLVVNIKKEKENELVRVLNNQVKKYRIKSRNYHDDDVNMIVELKIKDLDAFNNELNSNSIDKYSVIEYDTDDIV